MLTNKLSTLGVPPTLCDWILDFWTGRPQSVRLGNNTPRTITVNRGNPQGCDPMLYTLFTQDCVASQHNTSIMKFADDIMVIGLISGGNESTHRREVAGLVKWCQDNSLSLNISKTKEMIRDPQKKRGQHSPLHIRETELERVATLQYLGINISEDLTWTNNITDLVVKARQHLYFLRRLRRFGMTTTILSNFYRCSTESILSYSITVWFGNSTAWNHKALWWVVKTAQKITGTVLPALENIYESRALRRARNIIKYTTQPQHKLFKLLPSGSPYMNAAAKTRRLTAFFPPKPSGL